MRYFPVETSIERAKMTAYHAKAPFSVRRVADVSLTRERADGTYYAYFPFALTTEAAQMRPYHAKQLICTTPLASEVVRFGLDKEIALDG